MKIPPLVSYSWKMTLGTPLILEVFTSSSLAVGIIENDFLAMN